MIIALGLVANIEAIPGLAIQGLAIQNPAILGLSIHAPTDVVNVDAGSAMIE